MASSSLPVILTRMHGDILRLKGNLTGVPADMDINEEIDGLVAAYERLSNKVNYRNTDDYNHKPTAGPMINGQPAGSYFNRSAELEEGVRLLRLYRQNPPQCNWSDFKLAYSKCTSEEQEWFQSKFRDDEWDIFGADEEDDMGENS